MAVVKKIAIYGDSLALPRKGIVNYNERYLFLIEQWLKDNYDVEYFEIKDRATGGVTVTELLKKYEHDVGYYDLPADIVVFQTGIVDCAPRPVNDNTRGKIDRLPNWIKKKVIKYLHNNRSRILESGNFYVKTNKELFNTSIKKLLTKATVDYKNVYIINICPTNKNTENHSPGFSKKITEYNRIIFDVVKELNRTNIHLIDIHSYINDRYKEIDKFMVAQDGHHITSLTHKVIANMIIEREANTKL